MKKISIIFVISLLVVLSFLGFIIYKIVMLQKYKTENISIDNNSIFNEVIDINYNQNNDTIFEEMKYHDYFKDYVNKENSILKIKYNLDGEIESFYSIVKEKQYIYELSINSMSLIDNDKDKSISNFLNKNEIKDDIDLIKYIKENYYLKNSLFTSVDTMKNNYMINTFTQVSLPEFKSITLINSDNIKGYIINNESDIITKEIHLLHNDNQYIITLSGNEITNKLFINNLLETISFN